MRPLAPICKFAAFPTLTFCQQVRRDTAPIALGGLAKVQNSSPPGIAVRASPALPIRFTAPHLALDVLTLLITFLWTSAAPNRVGTL